MADNVLNTELNGQVFRMYKFRTMSNKQDEEVIYLMSGLPPRKIPS